MASLPLTDEGFDESRPTHMTREGSCWGPLTTWDGRPARAFLNYGSPFHKVAGVFGAIPSLDAGSANDVT